MFETQLITQVVVWERRLAFEQEKQKYHPSEPYTNYLAALQPARKEHRSIFARIFQPRKAPQPVYVCYPTEPCRETQPG